MSFGETITSNFNTKQDTNKTFFIKWDKQLTPEEIIPKQKSMQRWLSVRLNDKKVKVINY